MNQSWFVDIPHRFELNSKNFESDSFKKNYHPVKTLIYGIFDQKLWYCKMWKLLKFTLTQKFRESSIYTKQIHKELIWRNIFYWGYACMYICMYVIFLFFHNKLCTVWKLRNFTATISSQRTKELYSKLIWRKKFTWWE